MSALTDFAKGAYDQASHIIGKNTLAIGDGAAIAVVSADARHSRSMTYGGGEPSSALILVASVDDFESEYVAEPETCLGLTATHKGKVWRIGNISEGESFYEISLVDEDEQA